MTGIAEFITANLDHDEQVARASAHLDGCDWTTSPAKRGFATVTGYDGALCESDAADAHLMHEATSVHIALHDPARALRQVAAGRRILAEVMGWGHHYNDDDCWYSCGLAVAPGETEPGSGCHNDDHIGRCTCGLEARRMRVLGPLASTYADRDGYDPAWAVTE